MDTVVASDFHSSILRSFGIRGDKSLNVGISKRISNLTNMLFHCISCISFLVSEADSSRFEYDAKKKGSIPVVPEAGEVSVLAIIFFLVGPKACSEPRSSSSLRR